MNRKEIGPYLDIPCWIQLRDHPEFGILGELRLTSCPIEATNCYRGPLELYSIGWDCPEYHNFEDIIGIKKLEQDPFSLIKESQP